MNKYSSLQGIEKVKIKGLYQLINSEKWFVILRFELPEYGLSNKNYTIPLSDISVRGLDKYIPEVFCLSGLSRKETLKAVHMTITNFVAEHPCSEQLLPQGYSFIDNSAWVYTLGDIFIGNAPDASNLLPYNPKPLIIPELSPIMPNKWFDWCKTFCQQSPEKAALFLCALTPLIYPVAVQTKSPTNPVHAYVVGPTGSGKTEFSRLLTQIGGMDTGGSNLGSDKSNILELQSHFTDRPFLIDDMNLSSSLREIEKKKSKLSEIIQLTSSGGMAKVNNQPINLTRTSLIITGEFLLDSPSTINRCLVIEFCKGFDSKNLTYLQENKTDFLCFWISFASWICNHAMHLSEHISELHKIGQFDYRGNHEDADKYAGYPRLMSSHKTLRITSMLFLKCLTAYQINDKEIKIMGSLLDTGIETAIQTTLSAVCNKAPISDILGAILHVFLEDRDGIVAYNYDEYRHKKHKKIIFRHKASFFCRGKALSEYLSMKLQRNVSAKEISKELNSANLLVYYGGEATGHLPPKLAEKEGENVRYYRLNVAQLSELVVESFPDHVARLHSPIDEIRPFSDN